MSTLTRYPVPSVQDRHHLLGPRVLFVAPIPTGRTSPTYPDAKDLAEGSGTRAFAAVTTAADDWLVVEITTEQNSAGETFPVTCPTLTFANQNDNGTGGGDCRILHETAEDTAGGSRTVTITPSSGTRLYSARLTVVRDSDGPGTGKATSLTTQTVSVTRQDHNSGMFMTVGDFSAGAVGSPLFTPGGTLQASQQGAGATYLFGRWDDSGSQGTANHGITSPTYGTPTVAVLEMLGTSDSGGFTVNPTDSAGLTDTLTIQQDATRTDQVGLTDAASLAVTHERATTDSAGLTDAASPAIVKAAGATDAIGLTDAATTQQDVARTHTDTSGLTDAALVAQTHGRTHTDHTGLTDTAVTELGKLQTATDQTGLSDSQTYQQATVHTDHTGLTDQPITSLQRLATHTDQMGLSDQATVERLLLVAATDIIGLTDGTDLEFTGGAPYIPVTVGIDASTTAGQLVGAATTAATTDASTTSAGLVG